MMSDSLAAAARTVDLPDDAVPTDAVVIVGYLDTDGLGCWAMSTLGDASYSTAIGLLSMAGHELTHRANPTPCESDP